MFEKNHNILAYSYGHFQVAENKLHIKSQPPVPIKKPFSKTHALVFRIKMPEKF